jgi:hypothetical protein
MTSFYCCPMQGHDLIFDWYYPNGKPPINQSINQWKKNIKSVKFEKCSKFTTETGTCIDLCITNRFFFIESVDVLTPVCSTHALTLVKCQILSLLQQKNHNSKQCYPVWNEPVLIL